MPLARERECSCLGNIEPRDEHEEICGWSGAGKGNGEGGSIEYTNTHVNAGERVIVESGGDTVLAGAQIRADRVETDIQGDLRIENLQDRATYKERSKQVGGSVTFGAGVAGGSFSASATNIDSSYASVGEQSAIRTGDSPNFDHCARPRRPYYRSRYARRG